MNRKLFIFDYEQNSKTDCKYLLDFNESQNQFFGYKQIAKRIANIRLITER